MTNPDAHPDLNTAGFLSVEPDKRMTQLADACASLCGKYEKSHGKQSSLVRHASEAAVALNNAAHRVAMLEQALARKVHECALLRAQIENSQGR